MPIVDRRTRLKARRALRKQRRLAESAAEQADKDFNRLVFRRFERLFEVRRFVFVWVAIIVLMSAGVLWQRSHIDSFFLQAAPTAGGTYREGIIGNFTTSNPLFAVSSVDSSVARLMYSGLFKISPRGAVEPDLARDYEVNELGTVYTIRLKENVRWHDGEQFDSEDVVYTYRTIQNAEARSPLRSSWRSVKISAPDSFTVTFEIPEPLSSFAHSLSNGIVPQHILGTEAPENLRSSSFNAVEPVGTGPFKWNTLEVTGTIENRQERIALNRNEDFYAVKPGLNAIVIQSYSDDVSMIDDFKEGAIQSMVGLTSVPEELLSLPQVKLNQAALTSSVMLFMNNSSPILKDVKIRQALVRGTDVKMVRDTLGYEAALANSPFLQSQFPYNKDIVQLSYNKQAAEKLLNEEGWELNSEGIRQKDGKPLKLLLVSQSLSEYAEITQEVQRQWSELGIEVEAVLQPEEDLQKSALASHEYDVLLYGISIGYDPDVFAYWHSSQADPNSANLNLSEYEDDVADAALEAGRTRLDEELRTVKYEPFLKEWRKDAPAIALYQPRFFMVTRGTFTGFQNGQLSSATDRFYSVADWKVRTTQVVK